MKKIFLLLIMLGCATLTKAQATDAPLTIEGKVKGIKEGTLHLLVTTGEDKIDTICSVPFKKSKFKLVTKTAEPMVVHIVLEGYQGGFTLLTVPGEKYKALLSNDEQAYIKGGTLNETYTAHMKKSDSMRVVINGLRERYDKARKDGKFRSASLVNDTLKRAEKSWNEMTTQFLSSNDNLISAYTLYSNIVMRDMSLGETKRLYASLGEGAKGNHCARIIKERIERMEKTANNAVAPDFTATDINGNEVTMSKVPGKIKIIDFWASWCGPCRLNNPELKALYDEYHPKGLEVIGVSLDHKELNWKKAIEKDGLNWINVSSLKGWECEIARSYSVKGIPALFVLDRENRIIASGLRGEQLKEFIKENLK